MITRVDLHDKPEPVYTIYIGRSNKWRGLPQSKWANPFVMKSERERSSVIAKFSNYIEGQPELLDSLHELQDQILGCWCPANKICHGDVLIRLYNKYCCRKCGANRRYYRFDEEYEAYVAKTCQQCGTLHGS